MSLSANILQSLPMETGASNILARVSLVWAGSRQGDPPSLEQVDEEGRRAALSVARLVCTLSGVRWGLPSWLMDTARERARR